MAVYYVVDNEQAAGTGEAVPREFKSVKTLERPKTARVVKLEAGSVAEAQEGYAALYPGNSTGTPAVITEAAYKFS